MFSISSKKLFLFSRYSNFCIFAFPSFSASQPLLESLIQDKLKVYDVINCLNNLTYFFWYLKKEKRYHVETLAIDTVLNKEHFYGKIMQKMSTTPDNLIKYMDDTESMNTLTSGDLNTVLAKMVHNDGNCETEEPWENEVTINTIKTLYNFCCHFYHIFKNK